MKKIIIIRVVWRTDPNERIKDYQLTTVTYGTSAAPYLAIKTLQKLAQDDEKIFPEASKVLLSDFYVDDLISGGDSEEEVIHLKNDLCYLLKRGGFRLRKWTSNSIKVLESISKEDREIQLPLELNPAQSIKTLGLHWSPINDTFTIKIDLDSHTATCTILSLTAKLLTQSVGLHQQ